MSVRPIDSISAARERLQLAIAAYVAVAERIVRMIEEEEPQREDSEQMEAEQ